MEELCIWTVSNAYTKYMISEIKAYKVNPLGTNCYIFSDSASGKYSLVDPGGKSKELNTALDNIKGKIEYIFLTHGHFDHIYCADIFRQKYGGKVVINKLEAEFTRDANLNLSYRFRNSIEPFNVDILLNDGDSLMLGESKITMVSTPGHTVGSACFIVDDIIFSGDTLFFESVGRSDFITGSQRDLLNSLNYLKNLEGDFKVYPGHGEATTLEYERKHNIFMSGDYYGY